MTSKVIKTPANWGPLLARRDSDHPPTGAELARELLRDDGPLDVGVRTLIADALRGFLKAPQGRPRRDTETERLRWQREYLLCQMVDMNYEAFGARRGARLAAIHTCAKDTGLSEATIRNIYKRRSTLQLANEPLTDEERERVQAGESVVTGAVAFFAIPDDLSNAHRLTNERWLSAKRDRQKPI